ncbi:recombinase family protein [Pseudoclavibacter sp. 13-3]|uniref:recombinase family protein n=1 Tax=Pseudoclavibacter sp. 13-3 TaxID=2901228 RepID=UPI001E322537|nr:recombinase family protein [Pseudoclavibacter sp. 13-3]MCD7102383.1 recombinase family protein [Pseudoclavibacter sp. 13-3]
MNKYGYARVSTAGQEVKTQVEILKKLGIPEAFIVAEVISSRKKNRPGLEKVLEELETGDELWVTKVDRLGRSYHELYDLVEALEAKGVTLVINGTKHDPTTAMGRIFFNMLAVMGEFERDMIAERTRERLAYAKAEGVVLGRKPALTARQKTEAVKAYDQNISKKRIAKIYGVSRATVSKAIQERHDAEAADSDPKLRKQLRTMKTEQKAIIRHLEEVTEEAREEKEKQAAEAASRKAA